MASEEQNIKAAYSYQRAVEQIIGREGETATFLSRCLVSPNLCGGGFAPRHLNRWLPRGEMRRMQKQTNLFDNLLLIPSNF